ncbi:unnamed protein product [Leptidea sinapis]|uniref:Uncharacterized protein n=1 Tax=Leptidea sinapis TaxID=189913 RepID=A0A5E4PWA0_9NEOP|nr:unnamed protein product [Leptidea sinapis]
MTSQKVFIFLLICTTVHSASIIDTSYEYVMNIGKNLAPSFMSFLDCFGEQDAWLCAKEKAGKMLDSWDKEVDKQRSLWRDAADAEVRSSGRSLEEMPSVLGKEIEESVLSLSEMVQTGMARALYKKTESEKKIIKKPSQPIKPLKQADDKGPKVQSWVIGPTEHVESRGIIGDMWKIGENAIDAVAEAERQEEEEEEGDLEAPPSWGSPQGENWDSTTNTVIQTTGSGLSSNTNTNHHRRVHPKAGGMVAPISFIAYKGRANLDHDVIREDCEVCISTLAYKTVR